MAWEGRCSPWSARRAASPGIAYFRDRTSICDFYQVHLGEQDKLIGGARILPFRTFCEELAMP